MTYSIATGDAEGRATHWFASFLSSPEWMASEFDLQTVLDECNSRALANGFVVIGDPLVFESEADAIMFIMKWS